MEIEIERDTTKYLEARLNRYDVWSEEHTDILKAEWPKGTTGSQIGLLVNKSRNAVIGKANRMRLGARSPRNANYGQPKKERPPRIKKARAPTTPMAIINKKAWAPRFLPAAVPLTNKAPIGIMELNDGTCHAIVGHGANGLAVYCGDFTFAEKPFCEGHCAMYYQPPNARRSHR